MTTPAFSSILATQAWVDTPSPRPSPQPSPRPSPRPQESGGLADAVADAARERVRQVRQRRLRARDAQGGGDGQGDPGRVARTAGAVMDDSERGAADPVHQPYGAGHHRRARVTYEFMGLVYIKTFYLQIQRDSDGDFPGTCRVPGTCTLDGPDTVYMQNGSDYNL